MELNTYASSSAFIFWNSSFVMVDSPKIFEVIIIGQREKQTYHGEIYP